MTEQKYNRVQVMYSEKYKPYLYGVVHRVDGDLENQWFEKPFVISKKRRNGEDVVYGTVKRLLERIAFQVDKLTRFQLESQVKLDSAGISSSSLQNPVLPDSEVTDAILDDQDALIEDVLVLTSINIRILSEIFPQKLKDAKVTVYDYYDQVAGEIELKDAGNLIAHNRYVCIKDQYVVDLISNNEFMHVEPQMGLKIDFLEYITEVEKVIYGLTVKELVNKLWGVMKQLSASSNIRDIVLLHQNLTTLGSLAVDARKPINDGPLKTILDRCAINHLKENCPDPPPGFKARTTVTFTNPNFHWEPDLNQKQIRTRVHVNGNPESLVMDYDEFFSVLLKDCGDRKLLRKR